MSTTTKAESRSGSVPGEDAQKPQEIPAKGWVQIAKRGWAEAKADQVPLLAAGVAFYAFLAIFPAMIAGVTLYGLIADPATIAAQVGSITDTLPAAARELIRLVFYGLRDGHIRALPTPATATTAQAAP